MDAAGGSGEEPGQAQGWFRLLLPLSVSRREGGRRGRAASLPSVLRREGGGVGCSGSFCLRFGPGQHTRRTRPQRPLHGAQPASFGRAGPGWYLGPRRLRFRGRACAARGPWAAARGADSGKQVSGGRAVLVVRLRFAIRRPGAAACQRRRYRRGFSSRVREALGPGNPRPVAAVPVWLKPTPASFGWSQTCVPSSLPYVSVRPLGEEPALAGPDPRRGGFHSPVGRPGPL